MALLTSTLLGQNTQSALSEVKNEIRTDGISISLQKTEGFHELKQLQSFFEEMNDPHLKKYIDLIRVLSTLQDNIGLQDIDAYGYSVAKEGEFFDMDYFAHLKPGNEKALLWEVMGGAARKLKTFDLLPDNTILAITFRVDLLSLYNYLKKTLPLVQIDGVVEFRKILKETEDEAAKNGMPLSSILDTLSTEITIFLSLNKDVIMEIPDLGEVPQLAMGVIVEKKSDFLDSLLRKYVEEQFKPKMMGDYRTVHLTEVLPTGTRPGYASNKEYGIFSSDFNMVEKLMNLKPSKSLTNSEKFKSYKTMSRMGNTILYVSDEILDMILEATKELPLDEKLNIDLFYQTFFKDKKPGFFGLFSKKTNGLKIETRSKFNFPGEWISNITLFLLPGLAVTSEVTRKIDSEIYEIQREKAVERRRKQKELDEKLKKERVVAARKVLITEHIKNQNMDVSQKDAILGGDGVAIKKSTIVNDGLVAYWRLDETKGALAVDATGNTHHGIYQNGPQPSLEVDLGNTGSLDFEYTNRQYINCGPINLNGKSLTFSCWVKVESFNRSRPYIRTIGGIEGRVNSVNHTALLRFGDAGLGKDKLQFILSDREGSPRKLNGTTNLKVGEWYHIVSTYDGATMKLFIDGHQERKSLTSSFVLTANDDFLIGAGKMYPRYFDGKIDEFRVYNRSLAAEEIQVLLKDGEAMIKAKVALKTKIKAEAEKKQLGKYFTSIENFKVANPQVIKWPEIKTQKVKNNIRIYWDLSNSEVKDISALKGLPIWTLNLSNTKVDDISAVVGMPLIELLLDNTLVVDLSPLKDLPLRVLTFPPEAKNLEVIQHRRTYYIITKNGNKYKRVYKPVIINGIEAKLYWKPYDEIKKAEKLKVEEQIKAEKLKAQMQAQEEKLKAKSKSKAEAEKKLLGSHFASIEKFKAANPQVKEWPEIQLQKVKNNIRIRWDLSNREIKDISALQGLPIWTLNLSNTKVDDISAVVGMPLTDLLLDNTLVVDLSPLKDLPLRVLTFPPEAKNLEVIQHRRRYYIITKNRNKYKRVYKPVMLNSVDAKEYWKPYDEIKKAEKLKLEEQKKAEKIKAKTKAEAEAVKKMLGSHFASIEKFKAANPQVKEWTGFQVKKAKNGIEVSWDLSNSEVKDISALQGIPLRLLNLSNTKVSEITAVIGMPLKELFLDKTLVVDLSPLKGLPLRILTFPPEAKNIEVIRDTQQYSTIAKVKRKWRRVKRFMILNGVSADIFWKKYDEHK